MLQQIDTKARKVRQYFASLAELARHIQNTPRVWNQMGGETSPARDSWDLGLGYAKSWDMARWGWIDGAKRAQATLKVMSLRTPKPDKVNDFYGYMPNVPRFIAGAPDSMIRRANGDQRDGRILSIIVPIQANGSVKAEYMSNFGLGLAQYVRQLESDGTRVEITAISVSTDRWDAAIAWRVKAASQPLDLAVLAFAIGHPAMLRRIIFAAYERLPAQVQELSGYGASRSCVVEDVINALPGSYVLNGMQDANHYARTPEDALKHITEQLDAARSAK